MSEKEMQLKVFPIFAVGGFMLIMIGFIVGAFVVGPTANSYFGENTKQTRDSAVEGSSLVDDLVTISSIPRWLEPLIFLGVASFMFGIGLEFSTIPALLHRRGKTMKAAFPKITGGSK